MAPAHSNEHAMNCYCITAVVKCCVIIIVIMIIIYFYYSILLSLHWCACFMTGYPTFVKVYLE